MAHPGPASLADVPQFRDRPVVPLITGHGVLVVAATSRELATPAGWLTLCTGVGPVEAAAATAAELAVRRPAVLLHVGIAGARRNAGLQPGTLVIGSSAVYHDLMALPPEWASRVVAANPVLLAAAKARLPDAVVAPIGTSARVGGTLNGEGTPCPAEAMEGFAVLRAAERAGVPAIEVRAISNAIEETDRSRWEFERAFAAITAVTPLLVHALAAAVASGADGDAGA